jgi:hypothetical protein
MKTKSKGNKHLVAVMLDEAMFERFMEDCKQQQRSKSGMLRFLISRGVNTMEQELACVRNETTSEGVNTSGQCGSDGSDKSCSAA